MTIFTNTHFNEPTGLVHQTDPVDSFNCKESAAPETRFLQFP